MRVSLMIEKFIDALDCASEMRDRDRTADHERDVEGIQKLIAVDTNLDALLDVISDAVVTAQHRGSNQAHELFCFLVERAVFVSLRVEREEALDTKMSAAQQFFIHRRAISIKFVHVRHCICRRFVCRAGRGVTFLALIKEEA